MGVIVFDVDGVVLDFTYMFSRFLWKTQKRYIETDPLSWDFNGKVSFSDIQSFWASEDFSYLPSIPNIRQVIHGVEVMGYRVIFLTTIPEEKLGDRITNLSSLGISRDVYVSDDKRSFLLNSGWDIAGFIDDKPENVLSCIDLKFPCFSPVRGYNFEKLKDTDVTMYYDAIELLNHF